MPTAYLQKLAKEGKGSVESLEKKWDEAKAAASKEGHAEDYGYVTSIFQNMIGASDRTTITASPFKIQAMARMKAAQELNADSFEGFINTLGYTYVREGNAMEVIVDAENKDVWDKLKADGWEAVRFPGGLQKGDHVIQVKRAGDSGKTTIRSIK